MRILFFNKENEVRSGWKILLVILIAVVFILVISFILKFLVLKDKYGISVFFSFLFAVYIMLKSIDRKDFSYLGLKPIKQKYSELMIGLLAGAFFITLNVIILRMLGFVSFNNDRVLKVV